MQERKAGAKVKLRNLEKTIAQFKHMRTRLNCWLVDPALEHLIEQKDELKRRIYLLELEKEVNGGASK